jgi:hypothetical protein
VLAASLFGAFVVPWSEAAWAQSAVPATGAPAVGDTVRLKDGSVFRGTIVELVPGEHVDLLLPSGETRRFPMADVTYQGPVRPPPAAPTQPKPPVESGPDKVDVHVASDQEDVALLVRSGQSEFEGVGAGYRSWVAVSGSSRNYSLICNAPCDTRLPLGTHRLALSQGGGRAAEASDAVRLTEPSTLRVHYESRLGIRVAGWLIFAGSAIAGTILIADSASKTKQDCTSGICTQTTSIDDSEVVAGLVTTTLGALVSLVFILQHDEAHIEVVPLSTSRLLTLPGRMESAAVTTGSTRGLGVQLRF